MKKVVVMMLLGLAPVLAQGQTNSVIEKMRRERAEMQEQLARQEKILTTTESDIKSQVSNLNIITAKLKERTKILDKTRSEIRELDRESSRLEKEIKQLEKEHEQCRERYADACRFYQHQNASFNPLTFILATESFREMSRRARYVSEYSGQLREMADEISLKKDTLEDRKAQIELVRQEKVELQKVQQKNEEEARKEEKQQQSLVNQLKNKRTSLKKEITAQQKKMDALSKEIDRQIQLAIKEEQAKNKGKEQPQEDIKLSGSFESNKGRLPIPITGQYLVVGEYGVQNVAGMKDVKQNNLGIDIQGQEGAQAKAVFDGTVSSIFQQGKGQIGVLIRHGSYISVYCNLSETRLKKGDKVKTGDIVGNVQISEEGTPILHFQLHKESTRLNPSDWLRR
ncbi:MAG: peptidoglycan DD-metalloendopeptidase family protein [Bacteroidaceae bacterium]|jgi:septal ring factor EnvC (AmiA/AmiB activator)|nr:peptidoglycan DD-metalloendopeptidase family protein [Bacteroidaceae bacterium]